MYGTFPPEMQQALAPFVRGKRVVDLGYGDGVRSKMLLDLGAKDMLVVDECAGITVPGVPAERHIHSVFDWHVALTAVASFKPEVAHVAWPLNHSDGVEGLASILDTISVVIYVGKNTDGVACGTPSMWEYLLRRRVLAVVPDRKNVAIVYGRKRKTPRRTKIVEEIAGLTNDQTDSLMAYDGSFVSSAKKRGIENRARRLVRGYRPPVHITLENLARELGCPIPF